MSKFACKCGNVISDGVCPNEVTGDILSDKSFGVFFDDLCSIIDDGIDHERRGDRAGWMAKHFGKGYPEDLSLGSMVHDAILSRYCDLRLMLMECHECGRLWVQRSVGENHYREYVPGAQDGIKVLGLNQRKADD